MARRTSPRAALQHAAGPWASPVPARVAEIAPAYWSCRPRSLPGLTKQAAEQTGQWVTTPEPAGVNVNVMTARLNAGRRRLRGDREKAGAQRGGADGGVNHRRALTGARRDGRGRAVEFGHPPSARRPKELGQWVERREENGNLSNMIGAG